MVVTQALPKPLAQRKILVIARFMEVEAVTRYGRIDIGSM